MTYLLDTHALLWALTNPAKLGVNAQEIISSPSSVLIVSAVSAWEISTKHRLRKLPQADALMAGYEGHLDRLGAVRLPISEKHALLAGHLSWEHRDPFDRMLAAQAMLESHTLITNDSAFSHLQGISKIW